MNPNRFQFRVYDDHPNFKKMVYWSLSDSVPHELLRPTCSPIMQSTGTCDKDERVIFEGDIVKKPYGYEYASTRPAYRNFIVRWLERGGRFFLAWDKTDDTTGVFTYRALNDCEVIGNIYENPELVP